MSEHLVVIGNELRAFDKKTYRCAVGANGFSNDKSEGDSCTPTGIFSIKECLYRPDRVIIPPTRLKVRPLDTEHGWCDDPKSPDYNHMIERPYNYSHEILWRKDAVYDIILPISYNESPVVKGKGSAIFIHVAKVDYTPTEGCVALSERDLLAIISGLQPDSRIEIRGLE